jgi:hypothetical protein
MISAGCENCAGVTLTLIVGEVPQSMSEVIKY